MHKKISSHFGILFLCVGIIFMIIGIGVFVSETNRRDNIMQDAIPVTAEIVRIWLGRGGNSNSRAYIEYEVDGRVITATLNWFNSGMYVGMPVQLYVNRLNHREFIAADSRVDFGIIIIFGVLGLVLGGFGAKFMLDATRKRKRHMWLFEHGTPAWATVLGTEDDWSITVNNKPATVLIATYDDMRYKSEPLDDDDLANIKVKEYVKIFLHPEDNSNYVFDFNSSKTDAIWGNSAAMQVLNGAGFVVFAWLLNEYSDFLKNGDYCLGSLGKMRYFTGFYKINWNGKITSSCSYF